MYQSELWLRCCGVGGDKIGCEWLPVLVWQAGNAVLTVLSTTSKSLSDVPIKSREISMRDFFTGYRQTALAPNEIISSLFIPRGKSNEFHQAYKQAKRWFWMLVFKFELHCMQVAWNFLCLLGEMTILLSARAHFASSWILLRSLFSVIPLFVIVRYWNGLGCCLDWFCGQICWTCFWWNGCHYSYRVSNRRIPCRTAVEWRNFEQSVRVSFKGTVLLETSHHCVTYHASLLHAETRTGVDHKINNLSHCRSKTTGPKRSGFACIIYVQVL